MLVKPLRFMSKCNIGMIANAMRFDICLVNQVKTVLVTQLVETLGLRIVRGSHRIDVVHLHQLYILEHQRLIDGMTADRIVLVHVRTLEMYGPAVDEELIPLNLCRTESDAAAHTLEHPAPAVGQRQHQCVERG